MTRGRILVVDDEQGILNFVSRGLAAEIEVADSGSGIPTQDFDRIFERFTSGRRDAGSLGLGLAIVKTVAEAHGGSVRVRSQVGKGSAFELVLAEARRGERS